MWFHLRVMVNTRIWQSETLESVAKDTFICGMLLLHSTESLHIPNIYSSLSRN